LQELADSYDRSISTMRRATHAAREWPAQQAQQSLLFTRAYYLQMPANQDFRHNHYVAEWYQRRFMLPGYGKYWYLDLNPEQIVQNGHKYTRRALLQWGPDSCFAEDGLYTTKWGTEENACGARFSAASR
jgi:hypothetical protein